MNKQQQKRRNFQESKSRQHNIRGNGKGVHV